MRAGLLLALCLILGQLSSALATVSKKPQRETCDWESNVTKQPPTEVGKGTAWLSSTKLLPMVIYLTNCSLYCSAATAGHNKAAQLKDPDSQKQIAARQEHGCIQMCWVV